jgi:molybdenum cofactor cytidylyltransferase
MGRPKALLDFDGRPALALVLDACRGAGDVPPIVVVSPAGAAWLAGAPVVCAINEQPERGQLSSLQVGLARLPAGAEAFLVFPVDYPLVRAEDVAALVTAFAARAAEGAPRLFVPSSGRRRGHPLLVDAALAPEILALPAGATTRTFVAAHDREIAHVDAASDRVLLDMDTPEEYARCLARHRAGGP